MSDPQFPVSRPKWQRSLILVCEKCGKKLDGKGDYAQELKKEWKQEFQSAGLWGESRIVVTSCLDVCPSGEMAVARVTDAGPEVYTFKPKHAGEFLEFLKERERGSS